MSEGRNAVAAAPPSAKKRAYEFIKEGITTGTLPAGEFVTENQIAEQLGMSRTPVREAVQMLERAGFVRVFPKKGAYVPPIDAQEIRDVWEARQLVEGHCIRLTSAAPGPELGGQLRDLLEKQKAASTDEDVKLFIEHDREFHRVLVFGAGNKVIEDFYESLRDRQLRMGIHAVLSSAERFAQVIEEHLAIVNAVEAADPEAAYRALETHMQLTRKAMDRP